MRRYLSSFLFLSLTILTFGGPAANRRTSAAPSLRATAHESLAVTPALNGAARAALPGQSASDPLAGFDEFVAQVMKDWKVPGVAVAIVKDGKIILAKGYGERDTQKHLPVTPQTLFAIGSITHEIFHRLSNGDAGGRRQARLGST